MLSILDNDLYKFTMSHAYMVKYPKAEGTFEFINRDLNFKFSEEDLKEIKVLIAGLQLAELTKEEKEFMTKKCYYMPAWYWEWLSSYKYDVSELKISLKGDQLSITATGALYRVTLWEVPILALISKFIVGKRKNEASFDHKLDQEIFRLKFEKLRNSGITFSDFGTRRRENFARQAGIVKAFSQLPNFKGTSNCQLAFKYNLTPIGTVAHEWFMFHQAMYGVKHANLKALEAWSDVYGGDLGIALSDTYTSDLFFKNFSTKMAKLFDGVRHDSGDPMVFLKKTYDFYKSKNIDPATKTIVFSDALTTDKAISLAEWSEGKIKVAFGIGTHFTCDLPGVKAANVVMKLINCRMSPKQRFYNCVKISDNPGKYTGDKESIDQILKEINYELQ